MATIFFSFNFDKSLNYYTSKQFSYLTSLSDPNKTTLQHLFIFAPTINCSTFYKTSVLYLIPFSICICSSIKNLIRAYCYTISFSQSFRSNVRGFEDAHQRSLDVSDSCVLGQPFPPIARMLMVNVYLEALSISFNFLTNNINQQIFLFFLLFYFAFEDINDIVSKPVTSQCDSFTTYLISL